MSLYSLDDLGLKPRKLIYRYNIVIRARGDVDIGLQFNVNAAMYLAARILTVLAVVFPPIDAQNLH